MPKVLVTGGTGLIGKQLCKKLLEKGYDVSLLSREKKYSSGIHKYYWNIWTNEIDPNAIANTDYIIHLAGENIGGKRWTKKQQKLIAESRVKSGNLLFDTIVKHNIKLKAFISASAIGYYGSFTTNAIFNETNQADNDFLGRVCRQWEDTTNKFTTIGVRTVIIRTGLVLTPTSGVLEKMKQGFKARIGFIPGNGKQYLPWIHIDDICAIYIKAIEDENMLGAYNAVSPQQITYTEFMQTLCIAAKSRIWLIKIPAFLLKIVLGKMSTLVLNGSRVAADKIIKQGYKFAFTKLDDAILIKK